LDGTWLTCAPTKSNERLLDDEPEEVPTLAATRMLDINPLLARTITPDSDSQSVDSAALEPRRTASVAETIPRFDPHSSISDRVAAACTLKLGALLSSGKSKLNTS
jgi:hypothetical protein